MGSSRFSTIIFLDDVLPSSGCTTVSRKRKEATGKFKVSSTHTLSFFKYDGSKYVNGFFSHKTVCNSVLEVELLDVVSNKEEELDVNRVGILKLIVPPPFVLDKAMVLPGRSDLDLVSTAIPKEVVEMTVLGAASVNKEDATTFEI